MIPELLAALAFFGFIGVTPLVMMFLKHQRMMAELIHGRTTEETLRRLEIVENELRELKSARCARALREDDQRGLGSGQN